MLNSIHQSWRGILKASLKSLDKEYLDFLEKNSSYFPNKHNLFNAFKTLSLDKTKYILFGQDPYPRYESAIGYAFIDGKVKSLFDSDGGFSKEVNKATSLRNMLKMLLLCEGELKNDFSKEAIKKIDHSKYINSIIELKNNFERNGVLLLNSALVFTKKEDSKYHAKMWKPFVNRFLDEIKNKDIKLLLFGNISKEIDKLSSSKDYKKILVPHPYNVSFITDKRVLEVFCPMKLLKKS